MPVKETRVIERHEKNRRINDNEVKYACKPITAGRLPFMQCGKLEMTTKDSIEGKTTDDANSIHERRTIAAVRGVDEEERHEEGEVSGSAERCENVTVLEQRWAVLSFDQVRRLDTVMNEVVSIHGRGNFPTIEVTLKDLVEVVRHKLEEDCAGHNNGSSTKVKDIRLNGGAASYALDTKESWQTYNDLDLIFSLELSGGRHFDRVKTAVLNSLLDLLPEGVSRKRISTCSLKEAYVSKMVKVNSDGDCWSLISLGNSPRDGRFNKNVELKFVDTMKRPFEFSVDSFQIVLDSLLLFYRCSSGNDQTISENFYPTVVGDSVYGDFGEAMYHLQKKLIATRNPEEIRGGGLLKYCNLLVRNYQPAYPDQIRMLERYMCSRFFIDFPDINQQRCKLENYLWNHFIEPEEDSLKYQYLLLLRNVVDQSTVCLMGHERRQTLALIDEFAYHIYYYNQHRKYFHRQHHHHQPTAATYVYSNGYYYTTAQPAPATTATLCCNSYVLTGANTGLLNPLQQPPLANSRPSSTVIPGQQPIGLVVVPVSSSPATAVAVAAAATPAFQEESSSCGADRDETKSNVEGSTNNNNATTIQKC